jgi:hypothetical protein
MGGTAVSGAFCGAATQAAAAHNTATHTTAFQIRDCIFISSSKLQVLLKYRRPLVAHASACGV